MKKLSRMTALMLALMLFITSLPITALAEITLDTSVWQGLVNSVKNAFQQEMETTETKEYTVPVTTTSNTIQRTENGPVTVGGADVTASLPIAGTVKLVADASASSYQWQVKVGDNEWANIVGDTSATMTLTYAKIRNVMSSNAVVVRCVLNGDTETTTGEATVTLDETVTTIPETVTVDVPVTQEVRVVTGIKRTAADMGITTFGNETPTAPANYNIVINYVFANGTQAANPWTGSIGAGMSYKQEVTSPTVVGYTPDQATVTVDITGADKDYTYTVTYSPAEVNFKVEHWQQNVDNDQYTLVGTDKKTGNTESPVGEGLETTYKGFYSLLYDDTMPIAADGSTTVKIYYDRYYYLMSFDLQGGYGTEPVYARFGAEIKKPVDPTNPGYVFEYWTLNGVRADVPGEMPAENRTYVAQWKVGDPVNYTVVYWKENADDNGYSFWGQDQRTALAGTVVSGSDDIPNGISNGEKQYFTYNEARTDTDVTVAGDGSTVVNVYYYRNTYTIYFRGISGTCAIEEHTHGKNCNSYLDCLKAEHEHGKDCARELSCTQSEHEHVDECTGLVCDEEEHKAHTDDCLICTKTEHLAHTADCCTLEEHEHNFECLWGAICDKEVHAHGDGNCNCTQEIHRHSEENGCYRDAVHKHDADCNGLICGESEHKHTDVCYTYKCGGEVHEHTDSCYRPCTKLEHTHTSSCNRNSTNNVIYVVTAKYQQSIGDVWPTADKFTSITFRGWQIEGISNEAVSKRVTMTADLCDTTDKIRYATAQTGGSTQTLYYMFESHDQTSPANDYERILKDGIYYDQNKVYTQVVNSGSSDWGLKPIDGMEEVERVNADYDYSNRYYKSVFLYYNRIRYTLSFYNVNMTVKNVANIMYEQPLQEYKDSQGNLLRVYEPGYPSTLESNAYEFEGWYTTPECYEGTQFNFATATMPNNNLTLYAHWVPVNHTVTFYLDKEAYDAGTKLESHPSITVPHGALVDPMPTTPTKGEYKFIGWFYMDNGVEKAFDFANMQVRKDLDVYGKWSSNVYVPYTIKYVLEDGTEIAPATTGKNLASTTKTFDAKVGAELNEGYQSGYFPITNSHNMEFSIEGENTYSFVYIPKEKVRYTVKYLEKDTGNVLKTEKHAETRDAVITEKFEFIQGYAPDAYQKRLILSANEEENVIIFWYVEDTEHAPVQIIHWTQNIEGDSYTEYSSNNILNGVIGTTYTETPKTIEGFEYRLSAEGSTYVSNPSGQLTGEGLVLNLYYDRIEYPYEFKFLEQGTDKELATATTGNARYQAQVTEKAKTIPGYKLVSDENQAITIAIEDPADVAKNNVKIFYYQEETIEINYQVVGPDGCGTLSSYADSNVKVFTGTVNGSTPTANENFRFVGWFKDAACTEAVDASWVTDNKIVPQKTTTIGDEQAFEAKTYYAKFEYNLTTLTITKSDLDQHTYAGDQDRESAIFEVKITDLNNGTKTYMIALSSAEPSATILDVQIGSTYTITELNAWTWRYENQSSKTGVVKPDNVAEGVKIDFANVHSNQKWLGGDNYKINELK